MKLYITLILLLFTFNSSTKETLSPKQERLVIEKRLDESEKKILILSKKIDKMLILKNK